MVLQLSRDAVVPGRYFGTLVKIPVQRRVSVTLSVPKVVQCIPPGVRDSTLP